MTEQSGPKELVRYASAAERAGFDFEVISDHYSPWLTEQGHSPYAWSVLDAIVDAVRAFWDAGFTDVARVQVGDEGQDRFLDEAAGPLLERLRAAAPG